MDSNNLKHFHPNLGEGMAFDFGNLIQQNLPDVNVPEIKYENAILKEQSDDIAKSLEPQIKAIESIADSAKSQAESAKEISNSSKIQSDIAKDKAGKADIKSWIAIVISLLAFIWSIVSHFI